MLKFKNYIDDIIDYLQLDVSYEDIVKFQEGNQRCLLIEGEDKNGVEAKFLIYDCSGKNNNFDYFEYQKMIEEKDEVFQLLMIFNNWDSEWEIKEGSYKKLKNSKDRKNFLNLFDSKISYYIELKDSLEIEVDEYGENYLEYINYEDEILSLRGRVYNVSFRELKKIFNVRGTNLFRENVRFGLKKHSIGNSLQSKFKEYIKIGAYMKWIEKYPEYEDEKIAQVFEIEKDYKIKNPKNFWFYHNGITIYGNDFFDFSGNHIRINPKNISVINGAQTLTNFFECIKSFPKEFDGICENIIENSELKLKLKKFMKNYILEVKNIIKVKTIFIEGNKECLQPITCGLNTQIPIKESDILAISDTVESINGYLLKKNMKIIKEGENINVEKTFSVMEFVKYYLIVKNEPGQSKNLNRKDIVKHLLNAKQEFEGGNNIDYLLDSLLKVNQIEIWWTKTKKIRENMYSDDEKLYGKYGKNYFSSFILKQNVDFLDDESLIQFYDIFIKEFIELKSSPNSSDFKNDKLFEEYLRKNNKKQDDLKTLSIDYDDLKLYLNSNKKSKYTIQKSIREYLALHNVDVSNFVFRVIARTNYKVREAFPFPNSSFSEIYQNQINDENQLYLPFENSEFFKDIDKVFPVFIIDWKDIADERVIENLYLINKFSFCSLKPSAKIVYDKTIDAFKEGDETKFPKMSDRLSFHVRPKAINANDTFEFTNGVEITKRTFWANKDTMDQLINDFQNK